MFQGLRYKDLLLYFKIEYTWRFPDIRPDIRIRQQKNPMFRISVSDYPVKSISGPSLLKTTYLLREALCSPSYTILETEQLLRFIYEYIYLT